VVEEIAKLREEDLEEVAKQILTNSKEIFNI
jgi:Tat protein secretion system quality control protein TatD with DNase activity